MVHYLVDRGRSGSLQLGDIDLANLPVQRHDERTISGLQGDIPSPSNPPKGCPFSPRCLYMMKGVCDSTAPPQRELSPRHVIACHLAPETLLAIAPVITIEPAAAAVPVAALAAETVLRNDTL